MRRLLPVLIVMILLPFMGLAQERITLRIENKPFSFFAGEIQRLSGFVVHYLPEETDSLQISIEALDLSLDSLFTKAFAENNFQFAIDRNAKRIFISRNEKVRLQLAPGFFDKSAPASPLRITEEESAPSQPLSRQKLKISEENKLIEIGTRSSSSAAGKVTLAGYIRDIKNGEPVSGVALVVDSQATKVTTDQYGYYSITISRGRHVLQAYSAGMRDVRRNIQLWSDGKLNIDLEDRIVTLREVVVSAEKRANVNSLQMGVSRLSNALIKQVPVVFGEADVLKVVTTLPGVVTVGEGASGFNVRGGSTDQNLILFNDATIYNPSHLFGFFSVFNSDLIKSVELYKTAIPEKYGGRLSSVLDITSKEGNSKKLAVTGGIGPLTSKLTVEGPIIKDKTTFLVSGRTTYSDWLLKNIKASEYKNSAASFGDIAVHLNHTIDSKNSIFLNGYWSRDRFSLNADTVYAYSNRNANIKWKHNFNNSFYATFVVGIDNYRYSIAGAPNPSDDFKLSFDVSQKNIRADFNYAASDKHNFTFGVNSIRYSLQPGSFLPGGKNSLVIPRTLQKEQALESAIYLSDQYSISPALSINAGLRYTYYAYLGAHQQYTYLDGKPKDENTIIDSISYAKGKKIIDYGGPEVRLALRYTLSDNSSLKLSYNTLRQYIHLLTNTTAISPTDVWKLSDPNIKPQFGEQLSLGYYQNINDNKIETSVEIYYKRMRNFLDYKSGAVLVMNKHIETDLINSRGKAYGAELLIKKLSGKLNGWMSYTYSRTLLQTDDANAGELINGGKYYPANFDKPHSVNLITNYRFSHRFSMSVNAVYSTGRPITLPISIFYLGGAQRVYYSDRNEFRIPDYIRGDISATLEGNHRIKQFAHNSWSVGVYNVTARKNPYSIYFTQEAGKIKGYKLSIFGTAIPFITYNFRF